MRKSDIFESFIKLAQEKGMIPLDAPAKAKKILEENPRWGSDDISTIEALYGVKPDLPKDMEYKNNIMEDAHPNAMVISPSYDKLNGLVENEIERQNISLHIVHKTPDGLSTQRKYAEKEFILSLVRVGNHLDNNNIEELRTLADTCLVQTTSSIKKKAGVFSFLASNPLLVGTSLLLGGLYLQQHLPMVNRGFEQNHQQLIAEIDDLLGSNADWGFGYQYKSTFINMLNDLKSKLDNFHTLYSNNLQVIDEIQKPKNAKELIQKSQDSGLSESVQGSLKELKSVFNNMLPYLLSVQKNFASATYKAQQVEDEGLGTKLLEKVPFLHGGKGFIADDFDDVNRALSTYISSVKEIFNVLRSGESFQNAAQQQLLEAASESQEIVGNEAEQSPSVEDLDQKAGLLADLKDFGIS